MSIPIHGVIRPFGRHGLPGDGSRDVTEMRFSARHNKKNIDAVKANKVVYSLLLLQNQTLQSYERRCTEFLKPLEYCKT